MATAPRPGVSKRAEELAESQQLITIEIRRDLTHQGRPIERVHRIGIANLPMRERIICRKATGLPITAFWASEEQIDLDSIVVLWWMARRMNGEATLTFDQAAEDWPDDLDIESELIINAGEPDAEDDDPEA